MPVEDLDVHALAAELVELDPGQIDVGELKNQADAEHMLRVLRAVTRDLEQTRQTFADERERLDQREADLTGGLVKFAEALTRNLQGWLQMNQPGDHTRKIELANGTIKATEGRYRLTKPKTTEQEGNAALFGFLFSVELHGLIERRDTWHLDGTVLKSLIDQGGPHQTSRPFVVESDGAIVHVATGQVLPNVTMERAETEYEVVVA